MFKSNHLEFAIFFTLIGVASWYIMDLSFPFFHVFAVKYTQWPYFLVLIGGVLFAFGILLGISEIFIPAVVLAGVGEILAYQEVNGGLGSWTYFWSLLIGCVGVGLIFSGLFSEEPAQDIKHGVLLIVVSLVLFVPLSMFLGGWNWFGG